MQNIAYMINLQILFQNRQRTLKDNKSTLHLAHLHNKYSSTRYVYDNINSVIIKDIAILWQTLHHMKLNIGLG